MYEIYTSPVGEQYILRLEDNAHIPMVEGNMDYQKYLKWVSEGNTANTIQG